MATPSGNQMMMPSPAGDMPSPTATSMLPKNSFKECRLDSHDFKDCPVFHLEDFDFSFNSKTFKPSEADPNTVFVVMIYATWCGHCKRFMPEYKQLASKIVTDQSRDNSRIKVCCIDGSGEETRQSEVVLTQRLKELIPDFQGFPTVVLYKGGKLIATYNGERKAETLYTFIQNHL